MAMPWMPMPGHPWLSTAASLLWMWVVMMAPMMLPSLMRRLWHCLRAVGRTGEARVDLDDGLTPSRMGVFE